MKKHTLFRTAAAWAACGLLLAACGGGDGDGGSTSRFGDSRQFEGAVAGCTLATQKRFVRAYMDEIYLWYNEIPDVDPDAYGNIRDYFLALRVRSPDANGVPKDRFSDALPLGQAQSLLLQDGAVRQDAGQLLQATTNHVPLVFTDTTGTGRRFGYIQFNDHNIGAQDELIDAFGQVRTAGVQDLVLDLRFNSGGYLYIAISAASMVTGPAANGQVFEHILYNDKRAADSAASTLTFSGKVQFGEARYPEGTDLPQLGLPRVFVLTSGSTCSASESIINSLRGIGLQVVRVGSTTCGKPYGFRQKNNCGTAFFPVEFQGTNAQGFGGFTTGFTPTCQVQDNGATPGSGGDSLLAAAKEYIDTGACPAGTFTGVQSTAVPIVRGETPARPAWAGRLLLPQQR